MQISDHSLQPFGLIIIVELNTFLINFFSTTFTIYSKITITFLLH